MMQHCQMLLLIRSHKKWMVGCTFCILLQGKCSTEVLLIAKRKLSQRRKPIKVLKDTSVGFPKTYNPLISGEWQFWKRCHYSCSLWDELCKNLLLIQGKPAQEHNQSQARAEGKERGFYS